MDWIEFFDARRIHYLTSGPNVGRGQICCRCPWCGVDDPSEHLSINLAGKGFRCWRNGKHSGKNPAKLIQALLNCSWEQANQLAGNQKQLPNDFLSRIKAAFAKPEVAQRKQKLSLPAEFKVFQNKPSCWPYVLYLRRRGFSDKDIEKTKDYGIYYASQGNYKGRVIFTIVMNGELVGWTGRTIYASEQVRYKTLTHDAENAHARNEIPAPNPISHFLLFYDRLCASDASTLVLCEGPFDAWRCNLLGAHVGTVATCFFTSSLSQTQLNLLHELLPRFRRRILLLDQNTFTKSTRIRSDLAAFDVENRKLVDYKDPGEILSTKALQKILG